MYNQKILLADDDYGNLQSLLEHFGETECEVLYAPNGKVACEIAREVFPDIIIMDWAMPLMNGIEATLKLKAGSDTKDIPIIIATGMMTRPEDLHQALEAGAFDYILKPFEPMELIARVNSALRTSESFSTIKQRHHEVSTLLEDERGSHERELCTYAVYEHKKNEMLLQVRDELLKLEEEAQGKVLKGLRQLRRNLSNTIAQEKSWDNFVFHFENVHPHFHKKLKKLHPEITPNDLRIASYIKIGMDNKEIARITSLRVGSVRSNINRLKKRMSMGPDDSIRDFLMEI